MKFDFKPILSYTRTKKNDSKWYPSNFENFLIELNHIIQNCEGEESLPLFRGQADYSWPLDSLFLRNSIETLFNIKDYTSLTRQIRQSIEFNKMIYSLLFVKYGIIANPSPELIDREKTEDIGPWFELLKHNQQFTYSGLNLPLE